MLIRSGKHGRRQDTVAVSSVACWMIFRCMARMFLIVRCSSGWVFLSTTLVTAWIFVLVAICPRIMGLRIARFRWRRSRSARSLMIEVLTEDGAIDYLERHYAVRGVCGRRLAAGAMSSHARTSVCDVGIVHRDRRVPRRVRSLRESARSACRLTLGGTTDARWSWYRWRARRSEQAAFGGLDCVSRSGESWVADLVALRAGNRPRLIEVKATARGPYEHFRPAARVRLRALRVGWADAVMAWWPSRGSVASYLESEWPNECA